MEDRLRERHRMFLEIGLGSAEERERFLQLSRLAPPDPALPPVFFSLSDSTSPAEDTDRSATDAQLA